MCLLTFIPPHVQPDMRHLENGADNNPDGHGWAIVANGEVTVGHSMSADTALEQFELARAYLPDDGPALFHSRIATAGNVDTFNCHPFYVAGDKRTVLAHNGILPQRFQPRKGDARSDTHKFAETFLPKRVYGHFHSRTGRRRLRKWIGSGNKLALLTVDPTYTQQWYLINEAAGDWVNDVWYSNSSHEDWYGYVSYRWSSGSTLSSSYSWDKDRDLTVIGGKAIDNCQLNKVGEATVGSDEPDHDEYAGPNSEGKFDQHPLLPEVECYFCNGKGYVGAMSYVCHLCQTCQICSHSVDSCRCWWDEERNEWIYERENYEAVVKAIALDQDSTTDHKQLAVWHPTEDAGAWVTD